MGLEKEVKKIMNENPEMGEKIRKNQDLKDKLYGVLAEQYEKNKHFLYGAKWVDRVKKWANIIKLPFDIALGPILGYLPRGLVNIAEMIIELPYMAYYTKKVKGQAGRKSVYGARAAIQYLPLFPGIPGDIAGMIPLYERGAKKAIRKETVDIMQKYLSQKDDKDIEFPKDEEDKEEEIIKPKKLEEAV